MTESICAVEECLRHTHAKGWCKGHYSQARNNGGDPLARSKVRKGEPRAYFDANVMTLVDGCKEWPYMRDADGYGILKVGRVNRRVSRLACEAWHGPAPEGTQAAHAPIICHNRACFNGAHLSWVTPPENSGHMQLDGSSAKGARNGQARITDDIVRVMRTLHARGVSPREIGERFGVHRNTVDLVVHRRSWTHVQ